MHDEIVELEQNFEVKTSNEGVPELVTSLSAELSIAAVLLKLNSPVGCAKKAASKCISLAGCAGETAATNSGAGKANLPMVLPLDASVHVNTLMPLDSFMVASLSSGAVQSM